MVTTSGTAVVGLKAGVPVLLVDTCLGEEEKEVEFLEGVEGGGIEEDLVDVGVIVVEFLVGVGEGCLEVVVELGP